MEHNKTFMTWFKEQIIKDPFASKTLAWLGNGLNFDVLCCSGYEINGTLFYTKSQDDKSIMQNNGVTLEVESLRFVTSKYQNLVAGSMPYYGIIQDILEVSCTKFFVHVFKCNWVQQN